MIKYISNIVSILFSVLRSKFSWLAIFYMIWLFRVEFMPDTGGGMAKAIQIVSLFVIIVLLLKNSGNILAKAMNQTNMSVKTLILLYFLGLLSTVWAFMPQLAFFLSFQNIVMILAMVWMLTLFKDFKSREKTFIYFVLLSVVFENIAIRFTAQKVMIAHFLPAASSAAMLLSYSIGEYLSMNCHDKERNTFLKYTIVTSIFLLIINTSGGANASALFAVGVAFWLSKRYILASVITVVAIYILANPDLLTDLVLTLMPDKNMEQIETGNGRQEIWQQLMETAHERPMLGWGFACIERTVGTIFIDQTLSDAHNNYIGMYGSLGIVGLGLFILHYMFQILLSLIRKKRVGFVGIICATACAMVNGYSYGFMSGKTCSITVVYFAVVVLSFAYSKVKVYDQSSVK